MPSTRFPSFGKCVPSNSSNNNGNISWKTDHILIYHGYLYSPDPNPDTDPRKNWTPDIGPPEKTDSNVKNQNPEKKDPFIGPMEKQDHKYKFS